jgi:hypothetical protein
MWRSNALSCRGRKGGTRQRSEVLGEPTRSASETAIRRGHRQSCVPRDAIPVAFESLDQLDVLAAFQGCEAADAPIRVGATPEVCPMDVVMGTAVGLIAPQMSLSEDAGVAPPFGDADHPENHVGVARRLAH